jgi:hypothetical protein
MPRAGGQYTVLYCTVLYCAALCVTHKHTAAGTLTDSMLATWLEGGGAQQ